MAGIAYVKLDSSGTLTEERALDVSSGAGDATRIPALDSSGKIAIGFMPSGIGADTMSVTTSEALAAGDLVNVWSSTGLKARKADATTAGKEAHGFVISAASSGAAVTVYFTGVNTAVSGLTVGATQFLSTTAGGRTETAPTTASQVVQRVGVALSATSFEFKPLAPVTRA